jgi:Icc-related predicted phosphoesterase
MKKTVACLFLTAALILPLLSGCTVGGSEKEMSMKSAQSQPEVKKEVVLRFAAMSDVHLNGSKTQAEYLRFEKALDFMYDYSSKQEYKNFDVLLVAGDMTNNGNDSELQAFADIVKSKVKDGTQKMFVMGNHEYSKNDPETVQKRWESYAGMSKNSHIVVNGYHFIGVSPENYNSYTYVSEWLDSELAKAVADDPEKPVFVTQHYHIADTVYGSDLWGTSQLTAVLKKYPQIVNFSGHSHYPVNDPRSIHQKYFTSLGCGTLSYFELEPGMDYGTIPPDAGKAAQFYVVEVYSDNSVVFKPYDLITGRFFPTEYSITDPSDTTKFTYTDARAETSDKPKFADGTKLEISGITATGCTLSFKQATDGENLHSYRFDFYTKDGTKAATFKVWSNFYFLDNGDTMTYAMNAAKYAKLEPNTEYKCVVTAIDSYGKESENTIEASFTTKGE